MFNKVKGIALDLALNDLTASLIVGGLTMSVLSILEARHTEKLYTEDDRIIGIFKVDDIKVTD